ncbi:Hypothetical protein, putative [Bodo saltans]|uniref:Membrane-associated protein n=1 Tax=Bodo saltans TaxID=75058 RepID=A0A0S4JVT8_BODSA|nr:Hypothetical protein, putative [Bodo saltans]|eukprot:CUG94353.1 Hypothetical protein, putative [Bodo saltans]
MLSLKFVLSVVVVAFLVAAVTGEDGAPAVSVKRIGTNSRVRPIRTTLQACRADFRKLCLKRGENTGAVAPVSRNSPNECLQNQIENIASEVCKTWVSAEQSCTSALKSNTKCPKNSDIRRCFGKVSATELPDTCTSTEFYKSFAAVRIRGGLRNRTKTE